MKLGKTFLILSLAILAGGCHTSRVAQRPAPVPVRYVPAYAPAPCAPTVQPVPVIPAPTPTSAAPVSRQIVRAVPTTLRPQAA